MKEMWSTAYHTEISSLPVQDRRWGRTRMSQSSEKATLTESHLPITLTNNLANAIITLLLAKNMQRLTMHGMNE